MKWEDTIEYLESKLSIFSTKELSIYKPELLLSQALRNIGSFNAANRYLVSFEKHTKNNPRCRIEIAKLAFVRENYKKCIDQYSMSVNGDVKLLAPSYEVEYVKALLNDDQLGKYNKYITDVLGRYSKKVDLQKAYIHALARNKSWENVISNATELVLLSDDSIIYPLTLARYRLGHFEDAYNEIFKPNSNHSYEYFDLVSELAYLMEDYELTKYCYKMMIALFPDMKNKKEILEKLRIY